MYSPSPPSFERVHMKTYCAPIVMKNLCNANCQWIIFLVGNLHDKKGILLLMSLKRVQKISTHDPIVETQPMNHHYDGRSLVMCNAHYFIKTIMSFEDTKF